MGREELCVCDDAADPGWDHFCVSSYNLLLPQQLIKHYKMFLHQMRQAVVNNAILSYLSSRLILETYLLCAFPFAGSVSVMGWTGLAVPSLCCWDSSVALTFLTFATICLKSSGRMARMKSSKMWWAYCIHCLFPTLAFFVLKLSYDLNASLLLHSHWRRWQTVSGSTRSSTTRYLPSSTSTWRQWRRTVPLWSMFAVSSLLYTNL